VAARLVAARYGSELDGTGIRGCGDTGCGDAEKESQDSDLLLHRYPVIQLLGGFSVKIVTE
jgi:hypothetical protein